MKIDHDEMAAQQRPENHTKKWFTIGAKLLKNLKITPAKIGDFGAGKGEGLELLAKKFPEAKLYGFDYSKTNLETLNQKGFQIVNLNFDEVENRRKIFSNQEVSS